MKLVAVILGSIAPLVPAVASAWEACPPAAKGACGACGAHFSAASSVQGYASALGVGILVGVGSIAAEGFVRSIRRKIGRR